MEALFCAADLFAVCAIAASPPPDGGSAQPAAAPSFCWKLLADSALEKDEGYALTHLELAASPRGQLAVAWSANGIHAHTYDGAWHAPPLPPDWNTPSIAADSKGSFLLAAIGSGTGNYDDLARFRLEADAWVPAEEPPLDDGDVSVDDGVMALGPDDLPVLAWQASVEEPRDLHAAKWNGKSWVRLGGDLEKKSDLYGLEPGVAVAPDGSPWVAWNGGRENGLRFIRVARWTGTTWGDVGTSAKRGLSTGGAARRARLIFIGGAPLLVWSEKSKSGWLNAAARWDGSRWVTLPPLLQPSRSAGSPAATAREGRLVVGFSSEDASGQSSVYVEELDGGRWRWLAEGLRVDTGQWGTGEVALASRGDELFVAWEQQGIRAAVMWTCASGEEPRPFVKARPPSDFWPKTVGEAADELIAKMDAESKKRVREMPRKDLIGFHPGWGMGIRNTFGLWRGNDALLKSCGASHPDDCSMVIIERVWERLQAQRPDAGG